MGIKKIVFIQTLILGAAFSLPAYAAIEQPTVSSCVERTGRSEAECQKMVEQFKDGKRPEGERGMGPRGNFQGGEGNKPGTRGIAGERMTTGKEQHFKNIEARAQRIIGFLKSKGIDTNEVEGYLEVLETKKKAVTDAYATYETALGNWRKDQSDSNKEALEDGRAKARASVKDAGDYCRNTLFPALQKLLESVN